MIEIDTPQKRCTTCGEEKSATTEFFEMTLNRYGKLYSRNECRACRIAHNREKVQAQRERSETMGDVAQKRCFACKRWFPATAEFFAHDKYARDGWTRWCKECRNKPRRQRIGVVTVIKPPRGTPDQCGCCDTTRGNILGDVDKVTAHRYGYLCAKCLQLVRDFQSDAERIRKVLEYVESTR